MRRLLGAPRRRTTLLVTVALGLSAACSTEATLVDMEPTDRTEHVAGAEATAAPGDPQPLPVLPDSGGSRSVDPTDPIAVALDSPGEVALRLNQYLGVDTNVVLTQDLRLVRIGRTDIFAGPGDFEQWQLTRNGAERLLRAVLEVPVVASGVYNVTYRQGVSLDVGPPPSELNATPDNQRSDGVDHSGDIRALIELLDDPSWLGDDVVSGPEPWVPSTLTVVASQDPATSEVVDWPLQAGIRELGRPGQDRYEGALVLCLNGDDVAPVWNLLGGGTNYAHFDVDDGERWHMSAQLNWPGYRLISDPCGPDYDRYLEVTSG